MDKPTSNIMKYYKSWVSYRIPHEPIGPITYLETEPLKSFYGANYNKEGKICLFIKFLKMTDDKQVVVDSSRINSRREPKVYFNATRSNPGNFVQIPYEETESLSEYLVGSVGASDENINCTHVFVREMFKNVYNYDSENHIVERIETKSDGSIKKWKLELR